VIASDVGGVPDMLTPESGILVPPSDVDALASAMRELANDPLCREALGTAARLRYETVFAPDSVLNLLLEKYRGAIDRRQGEPSATPSSPHPWARTRA
jgi:glycosyltransferase involved in cell wall biosynthesis